MTSEGDPKPRSRGRLIAELAAPLLLLGWRLFRVEPGLLWRDWAVLVSLYWIFVLLAPREKTLERGTAVAVVALLAVYFVRQLPQAIQLLRYAW